MSCGVTVAGERGHQHEDSHVQCHWLHLQQGRLPAQLWAPMVVSGGLAQAYMGGFGQSFKYICAFIASEMAAGAC